MAQQIKEYFLLLGLNLRIKFVNLLEFIRVVIRYYPNIHFAKIDLALLLSYLFSNPFHVSKQFLMQKGETEIYAYGETPLTTLDFIARHCGITAHDVVFELGCGRGRTCFWLHQWIGCKVIGIDFVPTFIEKGQKIIERFQVSNVSFRLEDLFQSNLVGATLIYVYGTCFSAAEIHRLIAHLRQLPQGTKIITVSYSLTEFQSNPDFRLIKEFSAPFTWGRTDVYLQEKA